MIPQYTARLHRVHARIQVRWRTFGNLNMSLCHGAVPAACRLLAGPFWDIMYPAWTFWGGGPMLEIEPGHGLGRWDKKKEAVKATIVKW